jgi:DNA-binding FrmR family transcriptional regulator
MIVTLLLAACAPQAAPTAVPSMMEMPLAAPMADYSRAAGAPVANEYSAGQDALPSSGGGGQAAAVERLVIQNADVAIVVTDVDARTKAIEALAKTLGGYVVSSNRYQTQVYSGDRYVDVPQATLTIRVPSEKLDQALDAIKKDVVEVQSESRSGQDVTADYVDLQSRLKNLEATEAQLNKILENATDTQDVLDVFNQLTAIREQIELVKGQMKYYEESAALSAININVIAEATVQPLEIAGWKPAGVARDAIQGLINFLQGFADFFIRFFLRDLWIILLVLLPFYVLFLIGRAFFRRIRKPKAAKSAQIEETK